MKSLLAAALCVLGASLCIAGDLKVATMDLPRVLAEYRQGRAEAELLQQKEVSFLKDLETLRLEGRKLVDQAEELRRLSLEPVLSSPAREEKKKGLELKLADLRQFEVRYEQVRSEREAELQSQAARLRKRVMDDVLLATRVVGEKEGFHFIFNSSRVRPEASDLLFSRGVTDLTDKVLAALNGAEPGKGGTPKP
jgi:Skp family chaperone for outer membrane proteins